MFSGQSLIASKTQGSGLNAPASGTSHPDSGDRDSGASGRGDYLSSSSSSYSSKMWRPSSTTGAMTAGSGADELNVPDLLGQGVFAEEGYRSQKGPTYQSSFATYQAPYNIVRPSQEPSYGNKAVAKPYMKLYAFRGMEYDTSQDPTERLKAELLAKDRVITSLTEQLNTFKKTKTQDAMAMPTNYHQLFKDLTRTLDERTLELEQTKLRLEALVVSTSFANKTDSAPASFNGQLDEHELTHRIVTKLATLQAENDKLLKMISYTSKLSLLVEIALLKAENKMLKDKFPKEK